MKDTLNCEKEQKWETFKKYNKIQRNNQTDQAVKAKKVKQVSLSTLTVQQLAIGPLVGPNIKRIVLFEGQKWTLVNTGSAAIIVSLQWTL